MKNTILLAILSMVMLTSCSVTKKMKADVLTRQSALEKAAFGDASIKEKIKVLGAETVAALEQSLTYAKTKHTVKYIDIFSAQNEKPILKLVKDIEAHAQSLGTLEKVGFFANILKDPSTRKLVDLVPKLEKKVQRKVKTFMLLGKIVGAVKPF